MEYAEILVCFDKDVKEPTEVTVLLQTRMRAPPAGREEKMAGTLPVRAS